MRADCIGGITAAIALCSTLIVAAPGEPKQDQVPSHDCSNWSIKGLRLGMTLGEFKKQHPKAKHGKNWFRPDDRGRGWYFWPESRMNALYNYVYPAHDRDEAPIVSIMAIIDISKVTPSQAVDALVERWGPPLEREVPIVKVRYYTAFGSPGAEFDWKATTWQDETCDVLVTALEKTQLATATKVPFTTFTVSFDSIREVVVKAEQTRKTAAEAVRP